MKHTDSKYWWENLKEARSAYGEVCSVGWRGIKGIDIVHLYERAEPDALFVTYYALLAAIQDYVASDCFLTKYTYYKQGL